MINKEKFKKPKSAFFKLFVRSFEKRTGGIKSISGGSATPIASFKNIDFMGFCAR